MLSEYQAEKLIPNFEEVELYFQNKRTNKEFKKWLQMQQKSLSQSESQ